MSPETKLVPFAEKVKNARGLLEKMKPQLQMALPKHLSLDRMIRLCLNSIQKNPKLLECTQKSLIAAIMQSTQLGLECDGATGEAYLIPYGKVVQFIPGYRGLMKLARNTREISLIDAHEVYEKDDYNFAYGLNQHLSHTPTADPEPGEIVAFYAVARFRDGSGGQFCWMWRRDVDAVRDKSSGYQYAKKNDLDNPWLSHYAEMGKKTPIRRLCKYLPMSPELARAIKLDEQAEAGLDQDLSDVIDVSGFEVQELEASKPTSKLDALIDEKPEPADAQPQPKPEPKISTGVPEEHITLLCQKKGIPDEALVTKLGQMGIERKAEIQHKHMKELIEWAMSWRAPAKKAGPSQKNLVTSDYDDSE